MVQILELLFLGYHCFEVLSKITIAKEVHETGAFFSALPEGSQNASYHKRFSEGQTLVLVCYYISQIFAM